METEKWGEKSIAFERRGSELKVLLEEFVPTVKFRGETYYATEAPSITIGGKKYFVEEIA
ncbi:Uncharacterised protein [uncultured archaeon]|nr:Uncharacterised protein [uncultured archaeon]